MEYCTFDVLYIQSTFTNRAPCLLLLDDVDVLCVGGSVERSTGGGNRAGRGGSGTGVITALLHFMDGLFSSSTHGNTSMNSQMCSKYLVLSEDINCCSQLLLKTLQYSNSLPCCWYLYCILVESTLVLTTFFLLLCSFYLSNPVLK